MMEMNRVWEAKDYVALTKRLYHGCGCAGVATSLTPEEKQALRKLAESCEEYLRIYEKVKSL